MRRRIWWWGLAIGVPIAFFLVLNHAPIMRYRPSCGGWVAQHAFDGPMRDVFVDMMAEAMRSDGFSYIRVGNELFIPFADPDDFLINTDWKIASSIGFGYGPHGTRINPPPILLALMEDVRNIIEHDQSIPEEDKKMEMGLMFHGDCELFRAAAIRIEDVEPSKDLHYVPASPLPSQCSPYNMRGWRRDCGRVVRGGEDPR